jgi:hypothetical protein
MILKISSFRNLKGVLRAKKCKELLAICMIMHTRQVFGRIRQSILQRTKFTYYQSFMPFGHFVTTEFGSNSVSGQVAWSKFQETDIIKNLSGQRKECIKKFRANVIFGFERIRGSISIFSSTPSVMVYTRHGYSGNWSKASHEISCEAINFNAIFNAWIFDPPHQCRLVPANWFQT